MVQMVAIMLSHNLDDIDNWKSGAPMYVLRQTGLKPG